MSLSKKETARKVIAHLERIGITLSEHDKNRLFEQNIVIIKGSTCKVANTMTVSSFNVTVNKKWFSKAENKDRPYFRVNNIGPRIEFENILFPAKNNLFSLHYLKLRECCLELELEREKWFGLATWGVELDETSETFKWRGGNKIQFKLETVPSFDSMKDEPLKTPIAYDIEEPSLPQRALTTTYRILRDTKISSDIKKLYDNRCQICGERIYLGNNQFYAEAHHIKPLGNSHNGPDVAENILCICPNHHVMLDYGVLRLTNDSITISKHSVDEEYINYHNIMIIKK
jgi:hypothetical protein